MMAGTCWKNQVSNQALKHKLSLIFCFLLRTYVWEEALRLNHGLSSHLHALIYSENQNINSQGKRKIITIGLEY